MLFSLSCCSIPVDHSNPIATMQTLQRAMNRKKWSIASTCFTDEMRSANAAHIKTQAFYLTNYWHKSVGFTNLFGPVPLFDEKASFVVETDHGSWVRVAVKYHPYREKDVRLQRVVLEATASGWKVAELFGDIAPGHPSVRRLNVKP